MYSEGDDISNETVLLKKEAELCRIDSQIEMCKVRIIYWSAFATSDTNKNQHCHEKSYSSPKDIAAHFEAKAFEQVRLHINRMNELFEEKVKFIQESE